MVDRTHTTKRTKNYGGTVKMLTVLSTPLNSMKFRLLFSLFPVAGCEHGGNVLFEKFSSACVHARAHSAAALSPHEHCIVEAAQICRGRCRRLRWAWMRCHSGWVITLCPTNCCSIADQLSNSLRAPTLRYCAQTTVHSVQHTRGCNVLVTPP